MELIFTCISLNPHYFYWVKYTPPHPITLGTWNASPSDYLGKHNFSLAIFFTTLITIKRTSRKRIILLGGKNDFPPTLPISICPTLWLMRHLSQHTYTCTYIHVYINTYTHNLNKWIQAELFKLCSASVYSQESSLFLWCPDSPGMAWLWLPIWLWLQISC